MASSIYRLKRRCWFPYAAAMPLSATGVRRTDWSAPHSPSTGPAAGLSCTGGSGERGRGSLSADPPPAPAEPSAYITGQNKGTAFSESDHHALRPRLCHELPKHRTVATGTPAYQSTSPSVHRCSSAPARGQRRGRQLSAPDEVCTCTDSGPPRRAAS